MSLRPPRNDHECAVYQCCPSHIVAECRTCDWIDYFMHPTCGVLNVVAAWIPSRESARPT